VAWFLVTASAAAFRSRGYAVFRGVTLGVYSLVALGLEPLFDSVMPIFWTLHLLVFGHALSLIRPRMRSLAFRLIVSWPASVFLAGTLLAWPWAIVYGLGLSPWLAWLPYCVALIGLVQSLSTRKEVIDLVVRDGQVAPAAPCRHPRGSFTTERPLRIVQITDTHLGPFMSVARLRKICERAVAREPDLVVLTGDFLTMESQTDPSVLAEALSPLAALRGRTFACFGNHDYEAPDLVRRALDAIGARLLIDDSAVVETAAGTVQIVGADFRWRDRHAHLRDLCAAHPRVDGVMRLLLLHDPGAFSRLPEGEADLVLSGHTHGGQVGLVSLGLPWTMLRAFAKIPDHGFWARGQDRLYVHRGTGHYGFPLRVGVPAEESLLRVHVAA
jgi:predicted MPP superfamily phosphohydrolase